jgi:hypothetical protein
MQAGVFDSSAQAGESTVNPISHAYSGRDCFFAATGEVLGSYQEQEVTPDPRLA